MFARQLEQFLRKRSPRSSTDLDLRGRDLRAAGLLPTGGRGPHAPTIDHNQAVSALLAAGGTAVASRAAEAAIAFRQLKAVRDGFAGNETLAEALGVMLVVPTMRTCVERVTLMRFRDPQNLTDGTHPIPEIAAEILWRDSPDQLRRALYVPAELVPEMNKAPGDHRHFGSSFMVDATILGGGLLAELSQKLASPPPAARWAADDDKGMG